MSGGGAERQVLRILERLDRTRFEPVLYLAIRSGELLDLIPGDVPVFVAPPLDKGGAAILRRLKLGPLLRARHLARLLQKQQIDLVYDRTFRATLDAALATALRPTPRISCCVVDPRPELELHSRRGRGLTWRLARWAYRSASIVVANSRDLRQRLIDYFRLPPEQTTVLRNLLDLEELDRLAAEPVCSPVNSPFLIVAAGRLHPQKGYAFLIEALRHLIHMRHRQADLVILGSGDQESELRALIQQCGVEGHVSFLGFVPNPAPWYRAARLFVLPSLYEGLPNSLLEAVACGTPVVASDCPSGPAEILDQGRWGELVPPGDSAALAVAIEAAMDHYPDWQQRAKLAADAIRKAYDASFGLRELEQLLVQVWESSARRP